MIDERERQWRRRKFAEVIRAQSRDDDRMREIEEHRAIWAIRRSEALEILQTFMSGGALEAFRTSIDIWNRQPGAEGFGGFAGQMFLNQLVNMSEADDIVALLRTVMPDPSDGLEAAERLKALRAHVQAIKKGGHPAPGHVPFFASFFWSLQEPERWPVYWSSSVQILRGIGWFTGVGDPAVDYAQFRELVLDLGQEPDVSYALFWWASHPFVGLDPTLLERVERVLALNDIVSTTGSYSDEDARNAAEACARVLVGDVGLLGSTLEEPVGQALQHKVKAATPKLFWAENAYRGDGWVKWTVTRVPGNPSMRVWVTRDGVLAGLHCGWVRDRWYQEAGAAVTSAIPEGFGAYPVQIGASRVGREPVDVPTGEFVVGRWYEPEQALGREDFGDEVVATAKALQPVLDRLATLAGAGDPRPPEADADPLKPLVDRFLTETGYPTERDTEHQRQRAQIAAALARDELLAADIGDIRRMWSSSAYGSAGPIAGLNAIVRDADPALQQKILRRLDYLLWGEDPDDVRINRMLDPKGFWLRGLDEPLIIKLLAIAHPDRWLPMFPYGGENGKKRHLELLKLPVPKPTLSRGEIQVAANNALRGRADRLFPGDPWGMRSFLYWLGQQDARAPSGDEADIMATLADELLVDKAFLEELVGLLEDKGQLILYGPPGTGKTYVAQRLAAAIAPDASRRMLVQFHPSTSYEDFFEGYRPREGPGGTLSYELRQGPLALMADLATAAPNTQHVMVIDEINRGNLPKIFGELLFLLEYRDQQVRTTYRPDEPFELPPNLWFIGTMNTADRSIALVDAALRRRFHFVPFFPHEGPMAGLLRRWLERHDPIATWVADLVDSVNADLIAELGGPHLQIGPSHFMHVGIEVRLAQVWAYNVFPYVEDQLFGEQDRIDQFRLDRVLARFRSEAERGIVEPAPEL